MPTGSGRWWLLALAVVVLVAGLDVLVRRTQSHRSRSLGSGATLRPMSAMAAATSRDSALPASVAPRRDASTSPSASASTGTPPAMAADASTPSARAVAPRKVERYGWVDRAMCGPGSPKLSDWARYLQGFREQEALDVELRFDFAVEPSTVRRIASLVFGARLRVHGVTGLDVAPPVVYVHRDLATLGRYSCLPSNAVAFYDGAIHLPDSSKDALLEAEIQRSVLHEYTHHALLSASIREPNWFQEGLAMHVAMEPWRNFDITPPGLDVRDMVDGLPHTASAKTAERFYGQAYQMLQFLQHLCEPKPSCNTRQLVEALRDGAPAATFFQDSISARAPRSRVAPLELWRMYFVGLRPAQ